MEELVLLREQNEGLKKDIKFYVGEVKRLQLLLQTEQEKNTLLKETLQIERSITDSFLKIIKRIKRQ